MTPERLTKILLMLPALALNLSAYAVAYLAGAVLDGLKSGFRDSTND